MHSHLFSLFFLSGALPTATLSVGAISDVNIQLCTAAANDSSLRGAIKFSDDRGDRCLLNPDPTNTALQRACECLLIGAGASSANSIP